PRQRPLYRAFAPPGVAPPVSDRQIRVPGSGGARSPAPPLRRHRAPRRWRWDSPPPVAVTLAQAHTRHRESDPRGAGPLPGLAHGAASPRATSAVAGPPGWAGAPRGSG